MMTDCLLRKELKADFKKYVSMVEEIAKENEDLNLEYAPEEIKTFKKVKKWANIVKKADDLVNNKKKEEDIDFFVQLSVQLDVCKSLTEIDCVGKLKEEMDKINKF